MILDTVRRIEYITPIIINVYKSCGIKDFPFDCLSLLCRCGFDLRQYKNLPEEKRAKLMKVSPDAAIIGNSIFYNSNQRNICRMRFSLMHEAGHNLLGSTDEDDADTFASQILAPYQLIIGWNLRTADEVAERFNISISAANRALYIANKIKMFHKQSDADRELLEWFGSGSIEDCADIGEPDIKDPPLRLPPLFTAYEKANWSEEKLKKIGKIRRRRRKIAKKLPMAEEITSSISDFNLTIDVLENQRLGGEL